LTKWVEKCFGVVDEKGFWGVYWAAFESQSDLGVDRDPSDAEKRALDAIKAQPIGRLGKHATRKSLVYHSDVKPFLRHSWATTIRARNCMKF